MPLDLESRLEEVERLLSELLRQLDLETAPLIPNQLDAKLAKQQLQAELFTRQEAAVYTRRSKKHFDNTLRHLLNNYGSERRPLYSKKEVDECLNLTPGDSDRTSAAPTGTSAFRTKGSVSTNQRARLILQKLKDSRDDSTGKS